MNAALVVVSSIEDDLKRDSRTCTAAENLARHVISRMESVTAKLKSLEDDIRKLWSEFDKLKAGETILGCATKKEFCERKLNRTPRALQYMLAGGNPDNAKPKVEHERSEIISPQPESQRYSAPVQPECRPVRQNGQRYSPATASEEECSARGVWAAHGEHSSDSRFASHVVMAGLGALYNALKRAKVVPSGKGFKVVDANNQTIPSEPEWLESASGRLVGNLGGVTSTHGKIDALFPSKEKAVETLSAWRDEVELNVDQYTDQDIVTATLRCCQTNFSSLIELQKHRQDVHQQAAVGGNFRKLANKPAEPTPEPNLFDAFWKKVNVLREYSGDGCEHVFVQLALDVQKETITTYSDYQTVELIVAALRQSSKNFLEYAKGLEQVMAKSPAEFKRRSDASAKACRNPKPARKKASR